MAKMLHRLYPADNAAASHRALAAHQAPQQQVASGRAIPYGTITGEILRLDARPSVPVGPKVSAL